MNVGAAPHDGEGTTLSMRLKALKSLPLIRPGGLDDQLAGVNLDKRRICFEITETSAMRLPRSWWKAAWAALLVGVGFVGGAVAAPRDFLGKLNTAAKHLDAAQMTLQEAGDDFGGHKTKAMQAISTAQAEVKAAVETAKR